MFRPTSSLRARAPHILQISAALLCSTSLPVQASSDTPSDRLHIDAFGTFGLAWSELDQPRYHTDYLYPDGIGNTPNAKFDTRAGLQLGWTLNEQLEFNVQGLVANDTNDSTRVRLSWAYLNAQLAPNWSVKLGRFRTPTYMYADTLDVGYSYPWVRLPVDLYTTSGTFHSSDGVLLQYKLPLENGYLQIEPYISRTVGDKSGGQAGNSHITTVQGGVSTSWILGSGEWFASISRAQIDADSELYRGLLGACRNLRYAACDDYKLQGVYQVRYDLGWRYDDSNWMLAAEAVNAVPDEALSLTHEVAGYLSVGHHFGSWLPYATYSQLRAYGPRSETRLGPFNPTFSALRYNKAQEHTWTLGMRWDPSPGIALKTQIDRVHPDQGSTGLFTAPLPSGKQSVNVYSITLDWTY
jgi:hypothetical protein